MRKSTKAVKYHVSSNSASKISSSRLSGISESIEEQDSQNASESEKKLDIGEIIEEIEEEKKSNESIQ